MMPYKSTILINKSLNSFINLKQLLFCRFFYSIFSEIFNLKLSVFTVETVFLIDIDLLP